MATLTELNVFLPSSGPVQQPRSVMRRLWFLRGTGLFSGQGALSSPC